MSSPVAPTHVVQLLDHVACGRLVREARLKNGVRLKHLADSLGLSVSYLSRLERGVRPWTDVLFARAIEAAHDPRISDARLGD
jgi:hypothetical protein